MYGGKKKKALAGGGGWEGASWPRAKGLFGWGLAGTCAAPGLGTSQRFWQQRARIARRGHRAVRKRFILAGLLGRIL